MDIKSFFSKETAGLPNWAWALVIVVGAGVGFYFVKKQNANTTATNTSQAGLNAVSQPSDGTGDLTNTVPDTSSSPVYVLATTTPPTTGSTGSTGSTETTGPTLLKMIASGPLATTPGGTNNHGQNILTLPVGATLTQIAGPTSFNGNQYYQVSYNGQTGWVNAKNVALTTTSDSQRRETRFAGFSN